MKLMRIGNAIIVGTVIVATGACGRDNSNANTSTTAAGETATNRSADRLDQSSTDRGSAASAAMTVVGCLQKGDGRSFILTRVNEPSHSSVGTSGSPGTVEREQVRQAANAYRIDPAGDVKMDDLVGKQVRVIGTMADAADLSKTTGSYSTNPSDNTARSDANAGRQEIKGGDLAKLKATSVSMVAEAC